MEIYAEKRGFSREWAWRRGVINNAQWWDRVPVGEFMRYLGKNTRVGPMLGRDTVKNRLEKGDGMSFAEFSYPLIQAWDWWEQFQGGVQVQIGGADQFGNILAGAEGVKSIMREDLDFVTKQKNDVRATFATDEPMGFTVPLLTTASGEKFGKSAGNAVWIDPNLTSSFDLYQVSAEPSGFCCSVAKTASSFSSGPPMQMSKNTSNSSLLCLCLRFNRS